MKESRKVSALDFERRRGGGRGEGRGRKVWGTNERSLSWAVSGRRFFKGVRKKRERKDFLSSSLCSREKNPISPNVFAATSSFLRGEGGGQRSTVLRASLSGCLIGSGAEEKKKHLVTPIASCDEVRDPLRGLRKGGFETGGGNTSYSEDAIGVDMSVRKSYTLSFP